MSGFRIYFPVAVMSAAVSLSFMLCASYAAAQSVGMGSETTLETSPQYPAPNTEVTVSLNAYSMNTTGATINWYVDGIEQGQFRNARSIKLTAGELGTSQAIRAVISSANGMAVSVSTVLAPSIVDVIVEAGTSVPTFYEGRALPTSGAPVRIIAVPHTGSGGHSPSYSYKWELDGKVLFGGPLRGKNVIETTMPPYNDGALTVTVYDAANKVVARRLTRLEISEPEIHFYEENPLRGISRRAIGEPFVLIGEEVTVRAEPYFMNDGLENSTGSYEWRIDRQLVENPNSDPRAITLRKTGGGGTAFVELAIRNTKELLQYAQGSFSIFFE